MGYLESLRGRVGNRLIPLAYSTVLVHDEKGRMLFQHRSDFDVWGLPGGIVEPGESPAACARREAQEETGLAVQPIRLTAVLSGPRHTILYPNGDQVQQVTFFFECTINSGSLRSGGGESTALEFSPWRICPPRFPGTSWRLKNKINPNRFSILRKFPPPVPGLVNPPLGPCSANGSDPRL